MHMATVRFRKPVTDASRQAPQPLWRQPVLLWALVMIVAMLSFYVHLLNEQVQRGDSLRQAQRLASDGKPTASKSVRTIRVSQNTVAR